MIIGDTKQTASGAACLREGTAGVRLELPQRNRASGSLGQGNLDVSEASGRAARRRVGL